MLNLWEKVQGRGIIEALECLLESFSTKKEAIWSQGYRLVSPTFKEEVEQN